MNGNVYLYFMWEDFEGIKYKIRPIQYFNPNDAFKLSRQLRDLYKNKYGTILAEKIPNYTNTKIILGVIFGLLNLAIIFSYLFLFH